MVIDNTHKIVVLRDINSVYVKEAILVLRDTKKAAKNGYAGNPTEDRDFLVKEAQQIIDGYITECKLKAGIRRRKYFRTAPRKIPKGLLLYGSLFFIIALAVALYNFVF